MVIQHKTFSGEREGLEKNLAGGWYEQVYIYIPKIMKNLQPTKHCLCFLIFPNDIHSDRSVQ
jgi:hypothetical protein